VVKRWERQSDVSSAIILVGRALVRALDKITDYRVELKVDPQKSPCNTLQQNRADQPLHLLYFMK